MQIKLVKQHSKIKFHSPSPIYDGYVVAFIGSRLEGETSFPVPFINSGLNLFSVCGGYEENKPCQLLRDYRIPRFDTASNLVHEYSYSLNPSLLAVKSGERPIHDIQTN